MTSGHARETVPSSSLEGDTGHGPQARKGMSVVLIDQQTLTGTASVDRFRKDCPIFGSLQWLISRTCSMLPDRLGASI